jgi:hypothetical protein
MNRMRHPRPRLSSSWVPLLSGSWIIAGIAAAATIDVMLLVSAHLSISMTWTTIAFAAWGVTAIVACYLLRDRSSHARRVTRDLIVGISLFAAVSLLGAVASYPLATAGHGFVDPGLERIDDALHFHWITWYEIVAGHAWVQPLERLAYLSIFMTPAVLLIYFAFSGRHAESRLFVATFWVAAVMTLSLFPLLPAAGPFATLWRGTAPYMPLSELYQDQVILALRHHILRDVDLGALHGLVCAPSFHAASAVLFIGTAWRIGSLRWPLVALNLAMLLATPVEGTHYLADLLSGIAVALCALWLTPILIRYTKPRWAMRGAACQATSIIAAE